MTPDSPFAFVVRPHAGGWSWRAVARDGGVHEGAAPTRAAAAACVIHILAQGALGARGAVADAVR